MLDSETVLCCSASRNETSVYFVALFLPLLSAHLWFRIENYSHCVNGHHLRGAARPKSNQSGTLGILVILLALAALFFCAPIPFNAPYSTFYLLCSRKTMCIHWSASCRCARCVLRVSDTNITFCYDVLKKKRYSKFYFIGLFVS